MNILSFIGGVAFVVLLLTAITLVYTLIAATVTGIGKMYTGYKQEKEARLVATLAVTCNVGRSNIPVRIPVGDARIILAEARRQVKEAGNV